MTSSADSVKSTALIPYDPTLPHISVQTRLNLMCDRVATRSLENAKYAANHFPQVPPRVFTGRDFVHFNTSLNTPRCLRTDATIGVEIFAATPGNSKPPVVIFSHGYTTLPARYRPLLGELASHGYTILSLTHSSSIEERQGLKLMEEIAYTDQLAATMANNIQYVLTRVRSGALKDLGDPNRIVLAGHSVGGAASIMVSRGDPAILGCINLDGFLKGANRTDGIVQPLLMITGDTDSYKHSFEEDLQHPEKDVRDYIEASLQSLEEYEILNRSSAHSEIMSVPGAGHMDFTDQPFQEYFAGNKTVSEAMRVHALVSQKVLKFMSSVCDVS